MLCSGERGRVELKANTEAETGKTGRERRTRSSIGRDGRNGQGAQLVKGREARREVP